MAKTSKTNNPKVYIDFEQKLRDAPETEEDDGISFDEKIQKLTAQLSEQFKKSDKLKQKIKKKLSSIGYEF